MTRLSKNFTEQEMACKCGKCDSSGKMSSLFIDQLQKLRDIYGPVFINSAYRCSRYNAEIGGAKFSKHLEGIAADCKVIGPRDRMRFITIASGLGFTIIPYETFVHLDVRSDGPKFILT